MPSDDIERRPGVFVGVNRGTAGPGDGNKLDRAVDITPMVKRVRTRKDIGQPVGTFEIALTFRSLDEFNRSSLNKILVPDNLVLIAFDKGTRTSTLRNVMEGFVTRPFARTTVGNDGKPQREIICTGWDAGKFLVRHEIPPQAIMARLWGRDEEKAREALGAQLAAGTVTQLTKNTFRLIADFSQIQAATQGAIGLFVDPSVERMGGQAINEQIWLRYGKFWNLLRGVVDEPWNEIWADYDPMGIQFGPERYVIIVRRKPFDEEDWRKLPVRVLRDHEIRYHDTALSDDERVNVIFPMIGGALSTGDGFADQLAALYAISDADSMARHGTQPYQDRSESIYVNLPGPVGGLMDDEVEQEKLLAGGGDLQELLTRRGQALWDWYSPNHLLHKGSYIIMGDPDLKIGMRVQDQAEPSDYFVIEEGERRQYYLEQVIQDFVIASRSYTTHLAVTRGQPLGGLIKARNPARGRISVVFKGGIDGPPPPPELQ